MRTSGSLLRKLPTAARLLLGTAFAVFGLNYFVPFLPSPAPPSPEVGAFLGALVAGKLLAIVKIVELGAGLLLLGNRFVPLALTLLAPVEVGIVAFHGVYDPSGMALPAFTVGLTVYLAWAYRAAFAPMLRARVAPNAPAEVAPAAVPAIAR